MLFTLLKKLTFYLRAKILKVFGDLKVFKYPCWLVYDPKGYKASTEDFKVVLKKAEPFDVLLRRYDNYLDAYFIPGYWNHAALFVKQAKDSNLDGTVVHFMAEGCVEEDLFKFFKTDYVCLLRPKFDFDVPTVLKRMDLAREKDYDFGFNTNNYNRLYCSEYIRFVFEGCDHGITPVQLWYGEVIPPDNIARGNFEVVYCSKPKA
jgi:hypothetical protein